jgi:hypothetical protein
MSEEEGNGCSEPRPIVERMGVAAMRASDAAMTVRGDLLTLDRG